MSDYRREQQAIIDKVRGMNYAELHRQIARWLINKDIEHGMQQLMEGDIAVMRLLVALNLLLEEVPAMKDLLRRIIEEDTRLTGENQK